MGDELEVSVFAQADDLRLTAAVQRLRYQVYHQELGLDTPDMDHRRRVDVEDKDLACDCIVVRHRERLVGCLRLQPSGRGAFYAEQEFVLVGDAWHSEPHVEGARFAVPAAHRRSGVAVLLFGAFRDYCRQRGIERVISVSIVPDVGARPELAVGIMRWLRMRGVAFALDRGRPAPGYERALDGVAPVDVSAEQLPPMMHMLANPRTTLCSVPAYCRRFHTWNFLSCTRLLTTSRRRAS